MRKVALATTMLALSTASIAKDKGPPEPTTAPDWIELRTVSEQAVRARLVDPQSAQFDWPNGFKWGGYKPFLSKRVFGWATCGTVNSRNRMGGFAGSTPFVVVYDGRVRYIEIGTGDDLDMVTVSCLPPPPTVWGAASPASAATVQPTSIADEIAKLAAFRDKGILTPAEFETQKAKLLQVGGR